MKNGKGSMTTLCREVLRNRISTEGRKWPNGLNYRCLKNTEISHIFKDSYCHGQHTVGNGMKSYIPNTYIRNLRREIS